MLKVRKYNSQLLLFVISKQVIAQRCVLPVSFRWIYYCHNRKSTGTETEKNAPLCIVPLNSPFFVKFHTVFDFQNTAGRKGNKNISFGKF